MNKRKKLILLVEPSPKKSKTGCQN